MKMRSPSADLVDALSLFVFVLDNLSNPKSPQKVS